MNTLFIKMNWMFVCLNLLLLFARMFSEFLQR